MNDSTFSRDAILLAAMCYQANQLFEQDRIVLPNGFSLRYIYEAYAGVEEPEKEPFGFIAESRQEIVIAFRGTESYKDNESDQDLYQVSYPYARNVGQTHRGFTCIYQSTRDVFISEIRKLSPSKRILITGYSLGGGLAVLAAFDIALNTSFKVPFVYTYGSPRVADPVFANWFNRIVPNSHRIFNVHDIIPTLPDASYPPPFTEVGLYYQHVNNRYPVSFQLNSIARNHYISCYFTCLSNLDRQFTTTLCVNSPDFCPTSSFCTPFVGICCDEGELRG